MSSKGSSLDVSFHHDWRDENWSLQIEIGYLIFAGVYGSFFLSTTLWYFIRNNYFEIQRSSTRYSLMGSFGALLLLLSEICFNTAPYIPCGAQLFTFYIGVVVTFMSQYCRCMRFYKGLRNAHTVPGLLINKPAASNGRRLSYRDSISSPFSRISFVRDSHYNDPLQSMNNPKPYENNNEKEAIMSPANMRRYDDAMNAVMLISVFAAAYVSFAMVLFSSQSRFWPVDVNGCRPSTDYIPIYIFAFIFLIVFVPWILNDLTFFYETYRIRESMRSLLFLCAPLFILFVIWTHLVEPVSPKTAAIFPAGNWIVIMVVIIHSQTVVYPLYTTFRDERLLLTGKAGSREDFERFIRCPALMKKLEQVCYADLVTESIFFELEMQALTFYMTGFEADDIVPEPKKHMYHAIFKRYFIRHAQMELNLPERIRSEVSRAFETDQFTVGVFLKAREEILMMLFLNSYPKLLRLAKTGYIHLSRDVALQIGEGAHHASMTTEEELLYNQQHQRRHGQNMILSSSGIFSFAFGSTVANTSSGSLPRHNESSTKQDAKIILNSSPAPYTSPREGRRSLNIKTRGVTMMLGPASALGVSVHESTNSNGTASPLLSPITRDHIQRSRSKSMVATTKRQ